jgi:hypothetical protein
MSSGGKTVIFTVTTNGYKFLTWNLWLSIEKLGLPWKLSIVCLDKQSHRFFSQIANIPSIILPDVQLQLQGDTTKVASHGSGDFNRITKLKLSSFSYLLKDSTIERLLYIDSDIVLFRDPVPYIESNLNNEHSLWFQCDEHNPEFTCKKKNQEDCGNCCTGVIGFWVGTSELRNQYLKMISYDETLWKQCKENNDQEYIQKRMNQLGISYSIFSRTLFPNGSFLRDDHWKTLDSPYLLHFNFIVGGNKQRVMKSKGFWYVPY